MNQAVNFFDENNFLFEGLDSTETVVSSNYVSSYKKHLIAKNVYLYLGDCLDVMDAIYKKYPGGCFDMIFADPPYFLSNNGITCSNGQLVSVNKGDWDKSKGIELDHFFHLNWLSKCQKLLKPNGTIWVSGTMHAIHSIGFGMQTLGYKLLNEITWEKPNPPPNLSCRYFTHSTETLLWAAKNKNSKHTFNYDLMRVENEGKQMKSVWKFAPPGMKEKTFGKHPTQKPLSLLERCILSSTTENCFVFDPFLGSGTTAVAALNSKRRFCGVEKELNFIEIAKNRLLNTLEVQHD